MKKTSLESLLGQVLLFLVLMFIPLITIILSYGVAPFFIALGACCFAFVAGGYFISFTVVAKVEEDND